MKLIDPIESRNDPMRPPEPSDTNESINVSMSKLSVIKNESFSGSAVQTSYECESMGPKPISETTSHINQHMNVIEPHDNDVLCGRGGNINNHPGNETFRQIVEGKKRAYLTARSKIEKRSIVSSIVKTVRELNPPGRFLDKEKGTHVWKEVDEERALSKTSQALRENGPKIKKQIETENDMIRAEMRRKEEAEYCRNRPNYPSYGRHQYFDSNYHAHRDYAYPCNNYKRGQSGCHQCATCGNRDDQHNNHTDSQYYGNDIAQEHGFHQNFVSDDRNDRYPGVYGEQSRRSKEFRQSPPKLTSMDPVLGSQISPSYSRNQDEKRRRHIDPIDWRHTEENRLKRGYSKTWQHQNNIQDEYNHSEDAMIVDEVEVEWNRSYQQPGDSPDARMSRSNRSVYHYMPPKRSNGQVANSGYTGDRRAYLRNVQKRRCDSATTATTVKHEDETNSISQFTTFARSLFSWDSNTVISNELDHDSSLPYKSEFEGEGQEVELISIMNSMSIEEDQQNQQRWGEKPVHSQDSKEIDHKNDWSSKVGGCHSWFIDNIGDIIKQEDEIKITPVNSMELAGDSIGGTDANSFRGSVGGASLCYVFD